MVKAVFFDIDGTLVSFETHTIPQSTVDAITELKKRNIKVFIATGRALMQVGSLAGLEFDGFVTMNGSCCANARREVIHKSVIPREDIEALFRYQEEAGRFSCGFMTADDITCNYVDRKVVELSRMVNLPVPEVRDMHEIVQTEILQMEIYVDKEQEREIMRKVLVHCQASRWNPVFADINLQGSSKQSGIDRVLEHYSISLGEAMAFGDGGNDIPMLRHVATGIAMGNASPEVQRIAGYVTDTVDSNGIWNALKHFNLIG